MVFEADVTLTELDAFLAAGRQVNALFRRDAGQISDETAMRLFAESITPEAVLEARRTLLIPLEGQQSYLPLIP